MAQNRKITMVKLVSAPPSLYCISIHYDYINNGYDNIISKIHWGFINAGATYCLKESIYFIFMKVKWPIVCLQEINWCPNDRPFIHSEPDPGGITETVKSSITKSYPQWE